MPHLTQDSIHLGIGQCVREDLRMYVSQVVNHDKMLGGLTTIWPGACNLSDRHVLLVTMPPEPIFGLCHITLDKFQYKSVCVP
jgi:hypothetical protein